MYRSTDNLFDLRDLLVLDYAYDGEDENDDDSEDDEEEQEQDDDEQDDDEEQEDDKPSRPERQAARYRVQRNEARKKAEALQAQIDELQAKIDGNDDSTKEKRQKELEEKATTTEQKLHEVLFEKAFLEVQLEVGKFTDPEYVAYLLERDDSVEIDDGEVVGLDEAVRKLVKKKPDLVVSASGGADEDEDEDEDKPSKKSGSPRNRKPGAKQEAKSKTLVSKFPALAQR